jgi:hypothetical protein
LRAIDINDDRNEAITADNRHRHIRIVALLYTTIKENQKKKKTRSCCEVKEARGLPIPNYLADILSIAYQKKNPTAFISFSYRSASNLFIRRFPRTLYSIAGSVSL